MTMGHMRLFPNGVCLWLPSCRRPHWATKPGQKATRLVWFFGCTVSRRFCLDCLPQILLSLRVADVSWIACSRFYLDGLVEILFGLQNLPGFVVPDFGCIACLRFCLDCLPCIACLRFCLDCSLQILPGLAVVDFAWIQLQFTSVVDLFIDSFIYLFILNLF